ncbi:PAS domain S-box protein [Haloterrigena sp. SYSU A121-1]|uniref:histidine kinase n=1 Tax=Haloterrigena gelatinilytica TaxID=2741724 RepID=A0A8J8KFI8_9EURY|nr:PAS domain S-box protein [Haloterrigena gelatinilytica]NUB91616.1 PAS domain S-box protein [Haloterrigena gelatinilytica]
MTDSPPECDGEANGTTTGPNDDDCPEFTLDVRRLATRLPDYAVSILDADGRVATWNESVRALTGYEEAEVAGRHYRIFFPPEERTTGRPAQILERARAEGRVEDEGWRCRSDGSRFRAREVIVPVRENEIADSGTFDPDATSRGADESAGDVVAYASFLQDRTDEYERERTLREEKAFAESIFEAQPDVVYAFDAEGNFLEWNDRVPEVTGYAESELAEMDPLEFVVPEHRERIAESIQRILEEAAYVSVEADLLTKDGRRIPYEFNTSRITDDTGSVLGFTGVGRDVSEREARERELREEKALTESIFEAQPDMLYAYDTEQNLIHWNDRFEQATGYDPSELEGMHPLEFIAPSDRDHIADAIERILEDGDRVTAEGGILTNDGEIVPYEFNSARITDDTGSVLGFTGVGRDITGRKARERELERLERLNATIRAIDEAMVTAETRDEIESAIVETFADAAAYRFAAIGRVDRVATSDRQLWEPQTWDGIDASAVETVLPSFVEPSDESRESALETESVRCYHGLRESDVDDWRRDARERDYGAVAVVPITASGRTYGLLVVGAAESAAFTDRERKVLQEFGGTIGHAINAMAVRRLLYQDTVVELEFESTDRRDVYVDCSARLDCRLSIDHVLPLTDEQFVHYVTVAGAAPDRIRSVVTDYDAVEELRSVDTDGNESHWEVVVAGPTITGLLADYGARVRSRVADRGVSTTVVQTSPDVEIRDLVDAVTAAYPETEFVSKRTVERPVETGGDFRRRVAEELTEKQRTALEVAFYGGYFEWPTRSSDAGEIADRLGIARQTFHQHLRVAQAKLLTAYFEGGNGPLRGE